VSESDDVLAVHRPGPGVVVHKPHAEGSYQSHCAAAATEPYQRFGAWLARKEMASFCRSCFPNGWATDTTEGTR
jgi:hypothetical protein